MNKVLKMELRAAEALLLIKRTKQEHLKVTVIHTLCTVDLEAFKSGN